MGIERFFNSLTKNETIKEHGIILGLKQKINTENLYLDFNSIIYNVTMKVEEDLNYLLYSLILFEENKKPLDSHTEEICKQYNFSGSVEKYKTYFSQELLDELTTKLIQEQIIYIITQLVVPEEVKLLYLAFDGVPTMGKVIEQKKRRYNGYVLARLKKKIYDKWFDSLPDKRKKFEENKKHFDRSKIISWTNFIEGIVNSLKSDAFKKQLFEKNINLKQYIVSDQNDFGEGEKKIMEHIIQNKVKGRYVIYSPDADVIILSMIANNILNNDSEFTVLRFNQQSYEYDSVNISILINNIYNFTLGKINNNKDFTKLSVSNDIAFIFTLFGNDFVPRLESIDARNDIETIINAYADTMNLLKVKRCLIFTEKNIFKINYYALSKLINEIAKIENILLFDTYMSNKYKNYNFYKRELKVERLYPVLEKYIGFANDIFDKLRLIYKNENIDKDIDQIIDNSDKAMIRMFLVMEAKSNNPDQELEKSFRKQLYKIVSIALHNDSIGKLPIVGRLRLLLFDNNVDNEKHQENIKNDMPHPDMEITEYDIEAYKMEKKIGEYEVKLNATDFDLGSLSISILPNGNYNINRYNIIGNIIDYYDRFFEIGSSLAYNKDKKIITYDRKNRQKLNDLVFDYLTGLCWVFDFYFNRNDRKYNLENISTWFYPHHRSPLLYQVREVLNSIPDKTKLTQEMNLLFNEISFSSKYKISHDKYMTKLEHYLYVTPKTKHAKIPDKYKHVIDENTDIFPDLDKLVDKIWDNENINEIIECKRVPYINKCNLMCVRFVPFDEYKDIIDLDNKKYLKRYFRNLYEITKNEKFMKYV